MEFKERQEKALTEIREVLAKYEVALDAFIVLRSGSVTPVIDIIEAKKAEAIIPNEPTPTPAST